MAEWVLQMNGVEQHLLLLYIAVLRERKPARRFQTKKLVECLRLIFEVLRELSSESCSKVEQATSGFFFILDVQLEIIGELHSTQGHAAVRDVTHNALFIRLNQELAIIFLRGFMSRLHVREQLTRSPIFRGARVGGLDACIERRIRFGI